MVRWCALQAFELLGAFCERGDFPALFGPANANFPSTVIGAKSVILFTCFVFFVYPSARSACSLQGMACREYMLRCHGQVVRYALR